ncbi:MAG: cytochrome c biogenesis protein CcsA [Rickettsiales bacterium]|nr:cytochrome c biogenesis protein CcsA [Rickettsiales bacterium]
MINLNFLLKNNKFFIYTLAFIFLVSISATAFLVHNSPPDYQQGHFIKIMYVHVPSAWMSLGIYSLIGIFSFFSLIWKNPILDLIARKAALPGATFSLITLTTGSLWGAPIWGTWWVWDARLTSMLILFFFYISYIALCLSIKDEIIKSKAPAVLAIIGLINIPIVKFSVNLWTTLHQPSSFIRSKGISIDSQILKPLIGMFITCSLFFILLMIIRVQTDIIRKKILRFQYKSVS